MPLTYNAKFVLYGPNIPTCLLVCIAIASPFATLIYVPLTGPPCPKRPTEVALHIHISTPIDDAAT